MNGEVYHVRRATIDDVPGLRKLWMEGHLPSLELDKRFTEFQVATDQAGKIVGAIGFHIEQHQGLIHDEVYYPPEVAESVRPIFWERLHNIARNHGLLRVWALATTNFYRSQGMVEPDPESLQKLPGSFGNPQAGWLMLKLRDEVPQVVSLDREFALFVQTQKSETEEMVKKAQSLRVIAYLFLTVVVFGLVAIMGFLFWWRRPNGRKRE
jgi:N-acetylglutamate synthase-like GNAT family acetyltransferase